MRGGFDFLGYHFERGMEWPRAKSLDKFRDKVRQRTRRTQGRGLEEIIGDLNPLLRGWFEYFKHRQSNVLRGVDGWIRMRLRSVLRKWQGKRGRGHGSDHQRWPNSFFDQGGLFRLARARQLILQPH